MLKDQGKVSQFVHNYLMKTGEEHLNEIWGPKYRWEHTLRVTNWAQRLAIEEKADTEKCIVAALMHDVSHFDSKYYRKHGIKSAQIAREFLLKEKYPKKFEKEVTYAIKSHVGERTPETLEAKLLQDADTLDRFGYIRILLFGKNVNLSSIEALSKEVTSFLEYLEKLENGDYGPMWTRTGKTELEKLIRLYKTILNGVIKEIKDTKTSELQLTRS